MTEIQECADKLGLGTIEKMPFWAKGAAKIIKDADKKGVTVPFFACGNKYAESLGELAKKLKTNKKAEDKVNGASTKAK